MSPFLLLICLDGTKFVFLSIFSLIETICPKIWSKSRPRIAKIPLPVDVRWSKTSLLKLPGNVVTTSFPWFFPAYSWDAKKRSSAGSRRKEDWDCCFWKKSNCRKPGLNKIKRGKYISFWLAATMEDNSLNYKTIPWQCNTETAYISCGWFFMPTGLQVAFYLYPL